MTKGGGSGGNLSAIGCITAAVAYELLIRWQFYQLNSDLFLLAGFVSIAAAAIGVSIALAAISTGKALRAAIDRTAVLLLVLEALMVIIAGRLAVLPEAFPWQADAAVVSVAALAGTGVLGCLNESTWKRLRRAISLAGLVFVVSQSMFALLMAPRIQWPAWPKSDASWSKATGKSAQIFVLLDELNASSAGPIVDVLQAQGLTVRMKAVAAAGDGTAKVIPALFTGGDFESAKPCAMNTECGEGSAMSFSRVSASRDDVDVVGFFMPYCAIQGLRYCIRVTSVAPLSDWRWWLCAGIRRLGRVPETLHRRCAMSHSGTWDELREAVDRSIWRAPVWDKGGFLYIHAPLPHPPGLLRDSTLRADYDANVRLAADLVRRLVEKAHSANIRQLDMVIFSDHPLRLWLWCASAAYAAHPCIADGRLEDTRVPIIVVGDRVPDLASLTSNKGVFLIRPRPSKSTN